MKLSERTDLPVEIQNAIKDLEKIQDDPDKYWEALNKQIFVMDMVQAFDDATEKGVRLGKEVGMEEGRREGKQLGIQEGRQEGRQEGLEQGHNEEKLNIARKMKENGFDLEAIRKITDLEIEEIESL